MAEGTAGRAPRLLYLAFYFPPTRASGVYRARATANHFAAAGWDVTVVTPQREFFRDYIHSYDPSLEATVDPRVRVERVPFAGWQWEPDIRNYGVVRAHFPSLSAKTRQWLETRIFPEAYASWIPSVVKRAVDLHAEQPFDVVIATGNPYSAFCAAWVLHRIAGVPYVVDYRDAWTMNQYTEAREGRSVNSAIAWERRILRSARLALFVNAAQRDWHRQQYPESAERMEVLENGWEPELLGDPPIVLPEPGRPLRFGYLGTMTRYMPLDEFFEGWRLARLDPALADATVDLHGHLGFFAGGAGAVSSKLPLHEGIGVHYLGPLPKTRVADAYAEADVLLLILPGSRYVTSGKVYEYMATGKPIVSVHDPDCSANEPLAEYPLWFPAKDLSPESIADALLLAARRARDVTREDVLAARRHASRYTRDAQLHPLQRRLRKWVDEPRRYRHRDAIPQAVHVLGGARGRAS